MDIDGDELRVENVFVHSDVGLDPDEQVLGMPVDGPQRTFKRESPIVKLGSQPVEPRHPDMLGLNVPR